MLNVCLSLANLMAVTPNNWGLGDALALGVFATLILFGFAIWTAEREAETRRQEAAEQKRKRLEREKRCDDYLKGEGSRVVCAAFDDDKFDASERVNQNNSRDRKKQTTDGRSRAFCCAAFWTIVAAGCWSAASLSTQNASRQEENVGDSAVEEKAKDAKRSWDEFHVEIRDVADAEGSRWKSASVFQDAESEWIETTGKVAEEKPIGENKKDAENGEDKTAPTKLTFSANDGGEKEAIPACRAVSEAVVAAPGFRRTVAPTGELKSVEQIRAESNLEIAAPSSSNSAYSNDLRVDEGIGRASAENVVWQNRRLKSWAPTAAQSGQAAASAQPAQNWATAQSGQPAAFAQPAENLATAQSGQATAFAQPAENLATAQSGQATAFAQPAENLATATAQPAENLATATAQPAQNLAAARVVQSELAREFTPSVPLIPFPSEERASSIASVRYEARAAEEEKPLLERIDAEFLRIGERVQKSVLSIETLKRTKTKSTKKTVETGCGFLFQYADKVYLATNMHVVKDAATNKNVSIFLPDRTTIHPTKILTCADFDLAALELDPATLPSDGSVSLCYFGDSDELRVSNFVGTIGNPFGLRNTVTYGHVSSLQRRKNEFTTEGEQSLLEYVQIDAAINPGNSGGPLYNSRGEVVGVVAAIATTTGKSEGVAFAIPINLALSVLKSTIDAGGWSRSRMGVELETASRADFQGVVDWPIKSGSKIVGVNANSPAERAGLRRGDVVVEFDGEAIEDDVHFARMIAIADVSKDASLKFLRGARLLETSARLERPVAK